MIEKKETIFLALFVFIFSSLLFMNSAGNSFVYDDRLIVERNELIRNPDHIPQIFSSSYYLYTGTGLYRPLTIFSFALNYYASGFSKYSYHLVNILLHALVSVLIFLLLRQMGAGVALALASSLLFASHPIHTEVVANLAGRAELLYSLFFLAAFLLYIRSKEFIGKRRILFLSLSLLTFFLSLLSKESAIVFPAAVIVYDLAFGKEPFLGKSERGKNISSYLLFIIVALVYLGVRYTVLGSLTGSAGNVPVENPLSQADAYGRFLGATKVFGKYLWLLVFPWNLSADYSFNQIKIPGSMLDLSVLVPSALLIVSLFLLFRSFKRSRILFFSILFFYITYLLISNYFMTIGTIMGERLLYLPSLSFCILLGLLIFSSGRKETGKFGKERMEREKWKKEQKAKKESPEGGLTGKEKRSSPAGGLLEALRAGRIRIPQVAILCLVVILYSARTFTRNLDWKDEYSIFSAAEEVSPESVKVLNNLGAVLVKMKRYDEGIERFRKALVIYPDHVNARNNLAQAYLSKGDTENAEREIRIVLSKQKDFALGYFTLAGILRKEQKYTLALAAARKALSLQTEFPEAQDLLGKILLETGDFPGAEKVLKEAIAREPESVIFHNDLGLLYTTWKRFSEAIEEFEKAIALDPDSAPTRSNLGIAYRSLHRYEEAESCFKKALEISHDNSSIIYNLGLTYMDVGKYEMAAGEFKKIVAREPDNHEALTKLGYSLISQRKYDEAIASLTRAIEIHPRFEEAHASRGKAYFITGKYDEALRDYSTVLELNPDSIAARNNRGTIYALKGEYRLARAEWEEALRRAPDQQEIRLNLQKLQEMDH